MPLAHAHEGDHIDRLQYMTTEARLEHWLHHEVFSAQWWFLLALMVIPWLLLARFMERNRAFELLCFVFVLAYITTALDALGTELHIWSYTYKLFPTFNRLMPVDISLLPITYMFVYQLFPRWRTYAIALGVVSLGAAFAAEPLLVRLHIYNPHQWKHYYSLPIYFALGVILKWAFARLGVIDRQMTSGSAIKQT